MEEGRREGRERKGGAGVSPGVARNPPTDGEPAALGQREVSAETTGKTAIPGEKLAKKATTYYRGESPPVAAPPFSLKTGRAKVIRSGNTPGRRDARIHNSKPKRDITR